MDKPKKNAWSDCSGDLDCRFRDKFDEYRDSKVLSDLVQKDYPHWRMVSFNRREGICRENDTDPIPEIYHFAECKPNEFFAVLSVIFMNANSYWPPYNRQGLRHLDEELYNLFIEAWMPDPQYQFIEFSEQIDEINSNGLMPQPEIWEEIDSE